MRKNAWHRWSGYLFLLPYLVLFVSFLIVPLFYGLGLSLFQWEVLSRVPPQLVGLGNFLEALRSSYFWKAFLATFRFVIMTVPLSVGFALFVACGINAIPFKRQSFYRASIFLPTIISISVAGILWRWFFNGEFGLFNALLGHFGYKVPWLSDVNWAMKSIVFMTLWWTVGGPMVVLLAGLQQ
ncbi:MAG TPA: sugar ABC transporter permease, partial [bacterium]|nr:sugar ABC transporter permease [bacterium]